MAPGWRTAKFADWRLSLGQPASLLVLSLPSQQRATKRPRAGRLAFGWLEIWGKADLEHCLPLVMCLGQIWLEGHPANAPCRHFSIPINAKNNLWLGSPWKLICTRSRAWLQCCQVFFRSIKPFASHFGCQISHFPKMPLNQWNKPLFHKIFMQTTCTTFLSAKYINKNVTQIHIAILKEFVLLE